MKIRKILIPITVCLVLFLVILPTGANAEQARWMCQNNHTTQADCVSAGCSAALRTWTAWTKTDTLPEAGCYYLTGNVSVSGPITVTEDLVLDLNGYTVTREVIDTANILVYEVAKGGSLYLWSTQGISGTVAVGASTVSGADGLLTNTGTMVLDGITVDASAVTGCTYIGANSGAVTSEGDMRINNSVIKGYRHTDGFGTAIGTWGGSYTQISGADTQIIGGNATNTASGKGEGGVIAVNGKWVIHNGTFQVYDGTEATKHGGLIVINNAGEMTINGGTFYGHTVTANGGCINYSGRPLTINGGTFYAAKATQGGILRGSGNLRITGGTFIGTGSDTALQSSSGGLIYANGAQTVILGGTFKNGNDYNGGPNIYYSGAGALTIAGDAVIGGEVLVIGTATQKANLIITGKAVVDYSVGEFSKSRNIRLKYADAYLNDMSAEPIAQTAATVGNYSLEYLCSGEICGLVSGNKASHRSHTFAEDVCTQCGADAPTIASGTCGENLTWGLSEAGTLIVSGTGAMYSDVSWGFVDSRVKKVVLKEGVTGIGDYGFFGFGDLTAVTISDSVTSIGAYAFFGCSSLQTVTIPAGMTTIGVSAFEGCVNLRDVYYAGTQKQWNGLRIGNYNAAVLEADLHTRQVTVSDLDGNGTTDPHDAVHLLLHIMFGSKYYPVATDTYLDFDCSGAVDAEDAVYLCLHIMFGPQNYPL